MVFFEYLKFDGTVLPLPDSYDVSLSAIYCLGYYPCVILWVGNKVGNKIWQEIEMKSLVDVVNELRVYDAEREWFEFKENWFEAKALGEYISALSNSAAYEGKEMAYFVWGINDDTYEVVGTHFNPNQNVNGEPLKHFLARQIFPDIDFRFDEITVENQRVVVLSIPKAKTIPTA